MRGLHHLVCFALLVGGAISQPWIPSSLSCPSNYSQTPPNNLYIDIFNEVITNYQHIAQRLTTPPFISGMDPTLPAYEFTGLGDGFSMTNFSDAIRKASCLHKEVTFSSRVYIRDSQSDGPLIELAYSGGLEAGRPIYIVHMDAAANEIIIGYRHGGKLYSETIPVRLISGRWRQYSISLSGNLLSVYFDCEVLTQRLVPLPDYCYDESSVMLNVASSVHGGVEYTGTSGLYVYAQSLGVEFGPGGIKRVCPTSEDKCPTCGQFLSFLEKLTESEQRVRALEEQVKLLKESGGTITTGVTPTSGQTNDCVAVVNGVTRRYVNMQFLVTSSTTICYCDNGVQVCTNVDNTILPTTPSCPVPADTTRPQMETAPTDSSNMCQQLPPPLTRKLSIGELASFRVNNGQDCKVFSCMLSLVGLVVNPSEFVCADQNHLKSCSDTLSDIEKETAVCCNKCSACDFFTCGVLEECMVINREAVCECRIGYERGDTGSCVDINECSNGPIQMKGHDCPLDSNCVNNEGSFMCVCSPGYSLKVDRNGVKTCVDIDECINGTQNCPANTNCSNTIGSYDCICRQGFVMDENNKCIPFCDPPCLNGGECSTPDTCYCPHGFSGDYCEQDINECSNPSMNSCGNGKFSECMNTHGGYFCRCAKGYTLKDSKCVDVNECKLDIHNCIGSASCINTQGGYRCMCREKLGSKDCTGSCVRKGVVYPDKTSFLDNCRNCTCLGGELSCRKVECNCSDVSALPQECCHKCNRRDCYIKNGSVTIRPGASWIDPSNRCERYDCRQNLVAVYVNVSESCPVLDCPEQTQPMGKCCPVCMLPTCNASREGRSVSMQNGCKVYTCMNSTWVPNVREKCPTTSSCQPQDIVFFRNGCCPVCRHEVLGTSQTQCT